MSNSEQAEIAPDKPLNDRQRMVIDALCAGRTIVAAAKQCGVARRTAHGWLQQETFQAALAARRQEITDRVSDDIADISALALATVKRFLQNEEHVPEARVQAAMGILRMSGLMAPPKSKHIESSGSTS